MNFNYRITFINDQPRLTTFSERLTSVAAFALDIEMINWWQPQTERVALIQLAYRVNGELTVAVIDALAELDPTVLRAPLELGSTKKVMHNAAFDAVRLSRHFQISAAPIHDTLVAARRSGEKRYSLKAQVEKHLHLPLDKSAQ
jgi:ribonuclease D